MKFSKKINSRFSGLIIWPLFVVILLSYGQVILELENRPNDFSKKVTKIIEFF